MISSLRKKTHQQTPASSARVVDGKLILSMPGAQTPVVWQMDLGHVKASALEVQEDANKKNFILFLKTPKGEKTSIALFNTREEAISALMAASGAFEDAQGQIHGSNTQNINHAMPHKKRGPWRPILLSITAVIILFLIWSALLVQSQGPLPQYKQTNASGEQSARSTSGVSVSADDFLKGQ